MGDEDFDREHRDPEPLVLHAKCTVAYHETAIANWSSLLNSRPWVGMDLEIAECAKCNSTLAREVAP